MATELVKRRHPTRRQTPRQAAFIDAVRSGLSSKEASEKAGVCRQTLSKWRQAPIFIQELNAARNELVRDAQQVFREKITEMAEASIAAVSDAIKRGDVNSAKWLLEKLGFADIAAKVFGEHINPRLLPERADEVLRAMAAKRVEQFLTVKGISPAERLRVMPALIDREFENLKEEYMTEDAQNDNRLS